MKYRNSEMEEFGGTKGASFHMQQQLWEEQHVRKVFTHSFLPLIVICSLSEFMAVVYGTAGVFDSLLRCATSFMSIFLASQVARFVLQTFLPRYIVAEKTIASLQPRWFLLCLYPLAFLSVVSMLGNLVKVHIALLGFLPFYAVFMIWKGSDYAGIKEEFIGQYTIVATVAILGSAYLLDYIIMIII